MSTTPRPDPARSGTLPRDAVRSWSWADALATAVPGRRYRVVRVLFGLVRDRCRDVGCDAGVELTCIHATPRAVAFEVDGGSIARLEREYAWFVEVEAVEPHEGRIH